MHTFCIICILFLRFKYVLMQNNDSNFEKNHFVLQVKKNFRVLIILMMMKSLVEMFHKMKLNKTCVRKRPEKLTQLCVPIINILCTSRAASVLTVDIKNKTDKGAPLPSASVENFTYYKSQKNPITVNCT